MTEPSAILGAMLKKRTAMKTAMIDTQSEYPHQLRINNPRIENEIEMFEWCRKNLGPMGPRNDRWVWNHAGCWCFSNEEDLIMFKMVWSF